MSNTFSFGFADDDISEGEGGEEVAAEDARMDERPDVEMSDVTSPRIHSLGEMLATLPSYVSFTTSTWTDQNGAHYHLPRRELSDIRTQLMAEDETPGAAAIAGLSSDDIIPNVYEGGFKTWECSVDLASYLIKSRDAIECFVGENLTVIELGCGTAVPSLSVLLQHLTRAPSPSNGPKRLNLALADYNRKVLELATIPNLLLTTYLASCDKSPDIGASNGQQQDFQDLELNPQLLSNFQDFLSANSVTVSTISGSWTTDFPELLAPSIMSSDHVLILASETIYSPSSMLSFTEVLLALLRMPLETSTAGSDYENVGGRQRTMQRSRRAIVAAKKLYFGVGGGVDDFLRVLSERGGQGTVVWETEPGMGVARVILEVTA